MKYLIWSNEHNAWWRADSQGYTTSVISAGRYDIHDAIKICNGANYTWDNNSNIPHELPIAEEIALKLSAQKEWHPPKKPVKFSTRKRKLA